MEKLLYILLGLLVIFGIPIFFVSDSTGLLLIFLTGWIIINIPILIHYNGYVHDYEAGEREKELLYDIDACERRHSKGLAFGTSQLADELNKPRWEALQKIYAKNGGAKQLTEKSQEATSMLDCFVAGNAVAVWCFAFICLVQWANFQSPFTEVYQFWSSQAEVIWYNLQRIDELPLNIWFYIAVIGSLILGVLVIRYIVLSIYRYRQKARIK